MDPQSWSRLLSDSQNLEGHQNGCCHLLQLGLWAVPQKLTQSPVSPMLASGQLFHVPDVIVLAQVVGADGGGGIVLHRAHDLSSMCECWPACLLAQL